MKSKDLEKALVAIPGLTKLVETYHKDADEQQKTFLMEFALHGLAEFSLLSKHRLEQGMQFKDLLSSMFSMPKGLGGSLEDQ